MSEFEWRGIFTVLDDDQLNVCWIWLQGTVTDCCTHWLDSGKAR